MDIGAVLREERERRGLSLHDVQTELKIRERYLQALEESDYAAIPGEVYARGFLRSYARLLGLDADALLMAMPHPEFSSEDEDEAPKRKPRASAPVTSATVRPRSDARPRPMRPISTRRPRQWPWVVLPLLFIAALLYVIGSSHLLTGAQPPTAHHHSGRPQAGGGKKRAKPGGGSTGSGQGSTGTAATTLTPASPSTGPFGGTETNFTVAKGPITAQVTLTGSSWLYVSTDGSVVLEQMSGPGTYRYTANSAFLVKIGNPPSASLTIDGTSVPVPGSGAQSVGVTVQGK